MEYEFKVNIASRHRGRGIPRRDIFKIRRWRRDEERRRKERREKEQMREIKRAKAEATKIVSGEEYREQIGSPEKRLPNAPDMVRVFDFGKNSGENEFFHEASTISSVSSVTERKPRQARTLRSMEESSVSRRPKR